MMTGGNVRRLGLLVAIAVLTTEAARAQGEVLPENERTVTALRIESSIAIDGRLDEPAWQQAQAISDFIQFEPVEGEPASQRTEVRVLYGPGSLYVGAVLYDDMPERVQPTLGRRDEYNQADWFSVSIDPYLDRKTAYIFAVNAAGVQFDALRAEGVSAATGPAGGGDPSWNAIWSSSVRLTSEGWVAEIEIPYSMLRFSRDAVQTWGVHFSRLIPRLAEEAEWPLVPRRERTNLVAGYALLQGITGIEPRRNVQIAPYTVSRLRTSESAGEPGKLARHGSIDVGGDLKLGLGSNITLDATINPDFGQVESDPAELNLTAFETFFTERRPFFVEGTQIYRFPLIGSGSLLYTRRIGAQNPIIGAAKLSGRTSDGLSFGVLGAATGRQFEPNRQYGVVRLSQEIGEHSSAGGILTGYYGPPSETHRRTVSGGANWDLRSPTNTYSLRGFSAFTHNAGRGAGFTGQIMAARRQGTWTYEFGGDFVDHRFDPNDLGRQRSNNAAGAIVSFNHDVHGGRPVGPFRRIQVGGRAWHQWSYREGINLGGRSSLNSNWTLHGFQRIGVAAELANAFGGYDLFDTRGLWPRARPTSLGIAAEFATDQRREWVVNPEAEVVMRDDGGRLYEAGIDVDWNVGSRLTLSGEVEVELERGAVEWSSNETFRRDSDAWMIAADGGPPDQIGSGMFIPVGGTARLDAIFAGVDPVAGSHYYVPLYGARDTRALDVTLRTGYTFTPNLILQFYSQFFVARARYDQFRILQNPDVMAPIDAFPKRNEFSRSSFQFNTVLRWEYRPGSVLYLVWTQERRGDDLLDPLARGGASPYDRSFADQISDTFEIFPGNVFLVKLNYTFLN